MWHQFTKGSDMKTLALLFAVSIVTALPALAQTRQAELQQADPTVSDKPVISPDKVARYVHFQADVVNRMFGINVNYGGMVPMLYRAEQPLQLFNPFAAARHGNGFNNLSFNPLTGRAEGLHVFAIKF